MNHKFITLSFVVLILTSCEKKIDSIASGIIDRTTVAPPVSPQFIQYNIAKGEQYCDKNGFRQVSYDSLQFIVKFDSSAIYKTIEPNNQYDINKLYGFSDNNAAHHEFSARYGWRWSNNALRLFGYIYNNSIVSYKELGTVSIGTENSCSIIVTGTSYIFTLNGQTTTMPRLSTTPKAEGYKLYPYFGGDEFAPHNISIWIKELSSSVPD